MKNSEGLGAFKPNRKELNKPTTHFQTRSPIHHQQQEFTKKIIASETKKPETLLYAFSRVTASHFLTKSQFKARFKSDLPNIQTTFMSISERKEREKEQRRHEILKAAQRVFFRNGFEKTSMEMVAEECQLAKGTLYLYFKSKEELYVSLVQDGIDILDAMMEREIQKQLPLEEKLLAMVKTYYDFTQSHHEHFAVFKMIDVGTLDGKVDQEKLDSIQRSRATAFERMKNVVSEAMKRGEFKTKHEPQEIVMMLWAATFGAIMMCGEKCQQLDMFKEVNPEKFVMRIARALIESFKTANVLEEPLTREASPAKPNKARKPSAIELNKV